MPNLLLETSSHALSFAITLLALYPDVQRRLYEEVLEIWPEGHLKDTDTAVRSILSTLNTPLTFLLKTYDDFFPSLVSISIAFAYTSLTLLLGIYLSSIP
jgi:hypothetical protein